MTAESGKMADLREFVIGSYSAENLAALMYELAHAEAENAMAPTVQTLDYCVNVGHLSRDFAQPEAGQPPPFNGRVILRGSTSVWVTVDVIAKEVVAVSVDDGGVEWDGNDGNPTRDDYVAPVTVSDAALALTIADEADEWPVWSFG